MAKIMLQPRQYRHESESSHSIKTPLSGVDFGDSRDHPRCRHPESGHELFHDAPESQRVERLSNWGVGRLGDRVKQKESPRGAPTEPPAASRFSAVCAHRAEAPTANCPAIGRAFTEKGRQTDRGGVQAARGGAHFGGGGGGHDRGRCPTEFQAQEKGSSRKSIVWTNLHLGSYDYRTP
jgi:hypothetical protein